MGIFRKERHGQVARENVIERGNISRTLNGRMSAKSKYSTAGTSYISKQQLQNCCRPNDLNSVGMLCPTYGITDRSRFLRPRSGCKRFGRFQKRFFRNSAEALDHLRRITCEVSL